MDRRAPKGTKGKARPSEFQQQRSVLDSHVSFLLAIGEYLPPEAVLEGWVRTSKVYIG